MTTFRYLTAAEWGFRGRPAAEKLPDSEVYLHHVGGAATMGGNVGKGEAASRAMFVALLRQLDTYAIETKGYTGGLDYDALGWYDPVNDIGWVAEGRGAGRSAATLDRNEEGEAFCLLGNFSKREPLEPEIELCARGIAYMADEGWTTSDAKVLGHRDNPAHPGATGCPGDFLYPRIGEVASRRDEILAPPVPSTGEPWNPPLGPALDALALVMTYCACVPGGGSQTALWDVVLPHMTGIKIPAGDPRRTEYEQASKFPGGGRLARAWAEILKEL